MRDRIRADVVSALRALRASPSTVAAAVLTLGVAVGINLAMVGLVDRALLRPPPHVADPSRVFTLAFETPARDGQRAVMRAASFPTFEAVRDHVPAVSSAAAWRQTSTSAVIDGDQVQLEAMLVSGMYFSMLDANARLGRRIVPEDDRGPAGSPVAVLSHGFWTAAFGGDRNVLGRRLSIRGLEYQVIGVMPAGFSGHSPTRVDVWVPIHAAMRETPGWDREPFRNVVDIGVRVRRDQSPVAASAQASAMTDQRVILSPITGASVAPTEQTIAYWLTATSALVFIIGLANTATLLFVRSARRRRDRSIRAALGASRARLLSETLVESVILAVAAIGTALLLSRWFDEAVRQLLLPSLIEGTGINLHTTWAAILAGLSTIVIAMIVGAAQISEGPSHENLAGPNGSRRLGQRTLLLIQTAFAVVLLAGAGMFGRSLYTLASQDFGMRMHDVVLVEFELGSGRVPGADRLFAAALDRVRALPGVEMATPVQTLPFGAHQVLPISVPGLAEAPNIDGQLPFLIAATPELFEILGLEIVQGRRFTAADEVGAPVAIVNETMARATWPGRSALGQCFRIGFDPSFDPMTATGPPAPSPSAPCRQIVGVVRDVRQRSVVPTGEEARLMQYYVPFAQSQLAPPFAGPIEYIHGLMLRSSTSVDSLAVPIRRLVVGNRTDLPFLQVRPYTQLLDRQMRPWRTGTALLTLFSALALAVAAVGLYAAFAHAVAERRREMAVRIAVGAYPESVLYMILREATALAAIGVLCGCILATIGGRWIESLLFGTRVADPLVLGATGALMLLVATSATFLPARSASRTDPSALLRAE